MSGETTYYAFGESNHRRKNRHMKEITRFEQKLDKRMHNRKVFKVTLSYIVYLKRNI